MSVELFDGRDRDGPRASLQVMDLFRVICVTSFNVICVVFSVHIITHKKMYVT